MRMRVFITKRSAKKLVNNLRFAYHDYGRHLGLNVKFYNFPPNIKEILWESYEVEVAFDMYFGTPVSMIWDSFSHGLKTDYGLNACQSGRLGGYWGVYVSEYNDSTEKLKRIIRKNFYEAFCKMFCTNTLCLFDMGYDLDSLGNEFIYFKVIQHSNGKREYYIDGIPEWKNYIEKNVIPAFTQNEDDKWKKLAEAYKSFKCAWSLRKYVCSNVNVA